LGWWKVQGTDDLVGDDVFALMRDAAEEVLRQEITGAWASVDVLLPPKFGVLRPEARLPGRTIIRAAVSRRWVRENFSEREDAGCQMVSIDGSLVRDFLCALQAPLQGFSSGKWVEFDGLHARQA
jgi:hypothetical protein